MWGGVLGSLLLALFLGTYRYLRRKGERKLWQEVREAFILFLAGSICAIIAILLLYRFKELPLPINVNVNDFYGAIVIGLFTYKLGDWLFEQFFGKTEQSIKEEAKNKS
jgi:multisubunit Na+/H+ antiporter MnhB subunit